MGYYSRIRFGYYSRIHIGYYSRIQIGYYTIIQICHYSKFGIVASYSEKNPVFKICILPLIQKFSRVGLDADCMRYLVEGLKGNKTLTQLDLSSKYVSIVTEIKRKHNLTYQVNMFLL